MPSLSRVLTRDALASLAGDLSFTRGAEYAASGRVRRVLEDAGTGAVTAVVRGTHDYQVRLWTEGRTLDGECTCDRGGRHRTAEVVPYEADHLPADLQAGHVAVE